MNIVEAYDLGVSPYREVWDLQRAVQQRLIQEKLRDRDGKTAGRPDNSGRKQNDVFLFVEHPHVYTLGRSGNAANMLKGLAELKQIDAEFVENDRGGDITYHGPGQIVGYPVIDLDRYFTDIHRYLRSLEEVIIRVCRDYGLEAERIHGLTGVWVGGKKLCAFGIRCSRWVTMHGFAFNVNTDLGYFDHIVPCGIRDRGVTSLEKLKGKKPEMDEVKHIILRHFADVFDVQYAEGQRLPESEEQFSYLPEDV